jgi:membrane fusion protein (multidrug efflux system)
LVVIKLLFLQPENAGAPKGGPSKDQVTNVTGYVVYAEALENKIYSSGTVMANEEVLLRPEVAGKLVSILFTEGSNVTKGTLLAKINDADLQAQFKKLELQLKLAKERETRLKSLLAIKGISQEEYDVSANQLQTIAADMDYTKAQIAKTEIRAPFNGKIGLKQVSEGSFVSNTTIIASIQQTDVLKIDFTIPEKYAFITTVGDLVNFTVENQKTIFTAKVFAIEPRIDQQTRNITIRAIYNNVNTNIYPGSFAKVELIASKKQAVYMIPTEAVIPELKGKKVYICKLGKATPVKVETGTRTDAKIEIISGLNIGDTVITSGIMSIKPEASVKIIEVKK